MSGTTSLSGGQRGPSERRGCRNGATVCSCGWGSMSRPGPAHQASPADESGRFLWSGHRFRTGAEDLERLWAMLPERGADTEVLVILEPTRQCLGAARRLVPAARRARRAGTAGALGGPARLLPQAHQERPARLASARAAPAAPPRGAARRARPRARRPAAAGHQAAPEPRQTAHEVAGAARRAAGAARTEVARGPSASASPTRPRCVSLQPATPAPTR